MVIRLNDPGHVDDLCAHFRRAGLLAERVSENAVEVMRSENTTRDQDRHEIAIHLRVYEVENPGVVAEVD